MRHKSGFVAICCLIVAALCSVKADAEDQTPQPGEVNYATLYSAQVPLARGATLEELEAIAREKGSVEILTFSADGGQSDAIRRELVVLGEKGIGYPGLSIRTQQFLAKLKAAGRAITGAEPNTMKATIESAAFALDIVWSFPDGAEAPLTVSYSVEQEEIMRIAIYGTNTLPTDENLMRPRLVHSRGVDGPTDIIQVFEYSTEKPSFDPLYSDWEDKSRVSQMSHSRQGITAGANQSREPDSPEDVGMGQRSVSAGSSDAVDFGPEDIGGPSADYDSGWLPGGELGDSGIQARAQASVGLQIARAEVSGTFTLSDQTLCAESGSGFIEIGPIGAQASLEGYICVTFLEFLPEFLEIEVCPGVFDIIAVLREVLPNIPDLDFLIEDRTDFSSFLLGSCETATDSASFPLLPDTSLLDALCLAFTLPPELCSIANFFGDVGVEVVLKVDGQVELCGESISVSDESLFTSEGQCTPVDTCDGYHEVANYNHTADVAVGVELCPLLYVELVGVRKEKCFCLPEWEIFSQPLDFEFDSSGLDFDVDCPPECEGEHCGNGICDCGETNVSCPEDNCPQDCADHCGNGVCDCGETDISCPVDNCPDGEEPVCDANGPYFVTEGGSVQLDGSNSSDLNQATATLNFEWDLDGDGVFGETGVGADQGNETGVAPVFHAAGIDGPSTKTVLLRVTDNSGLADECDASVQVGNRAPEVAPPSLGSQSVQYSDPIEEVVLTATAPAFETMTASTTWNVNGGAFASGLPSALTLTQLDCVVDDEDDDDEFATVMQTCTWGLSGIVGVPEGIYRVVIAIRDDDGGEDETSTVINVFPEDADVAFDGDNPVGVQVDAPSGDSPPFSLLVHVNETLPDQSVAQPPAPGNIGFAVVSMTLVPVGPGGPVTTECVPVGVNGSGYDSVLTVSCNFDDVDVNTYIIQATVVGGYYTGYGEDVLVIFDPSLGFTTGGGWFYWPGTEDPDTGYAGDRTNFGYTMKYTKKRKNVRGSLLLIRHLADGTIYRVKSNALQDLAIGQEESPESFGWASFVGKATYKEPDWPDPIGNYLFITYAEDRGEPGSSDRFWLEIRDKDREVVPNLSIEFPATANAVTLNGGNIIVPHNPDDQPNNSAQNGPNGLSGNEQGSQTTEPRGGTCGLGMMAFALLAFGLSLLRLRFGCRRS